MPDTSAAMLSGTRMPRATTAMARYDACATAMSFESAPSARDEKAATAPIQPTDKSSIHQLARLGY